ncbi:hypothetical protein SAMN05444161_7266 [Rhizobiales bacterium GAS191]|jgi:hypothetical protein|nr:hypothetical protein SAMN05519103_06618 [Rhizobiales bacterium GAS113]SED71979.1 hypothetical protein SAMN05519104_4177 [Rhizobiales bacterium GAS188]SEE81282.1 hypothetical protein SAMN05444161_7266 [Rhizobiales bacterium GAS191]
MIPPITSIINTPAIRKVQAVSRQPGADDVYIAGVNSDGKRKGAGRASGKSAHGGGKPSSAQARSSNAVQAALTELKLGGS